MSFELENFLDTDEVISAEHLSDLTKQWLLNVDSASHQTKEIVYEKSLWFFQHKQLHFLSEELGDYIKRLKIGSIYPVDIYRDIRTRTAGTETEFLLQLSVQNKIRGSLFTYECRFYNKSFVVRFVYKKEIELYTGFVCGEFDSCKNTLRLDYGGSESDFYKYLRKIPIITSPAHKLFKTDLEFLRSWIYRHFMSIMTTYKLLEM